MKSILTLFTIAAVTFTLGTETALAKPGKGKGKGKDKTHQAGKKHAKKPSPSGKPIPPGHAKKQSGKKVPKGTGPQHGEVRVRFHDRERESLRVHFSKYKSHPHGLPPGLAKNLARGKPLPPGWQKKLHEGWIIDDAWWGHFHPVPSSYLPSGFEHPRDTGVYLIGDRLVRVHQPRRQVVDLIQVSSIILGR